MQNEACHCLFVKEFGSIYTKSLIWDDDSVFAI